MSFTHRNFACWLEDNFLFQLLFILKKLFLTNPFFIHYSGAAEDINLKKLFPKDYRGIYVDVGCYHPVKYSNTFMLYKRGWRGINIDIDKIKIKMFRIRRSGDTNIQCAVSNKNGSATYYKHGYFSQVNSLDSNAKTENCREETVQCRRLTNIIDNTAYKDRHIDLLSVDAEGHDLEVIKSLDFDRYSPSVIIVELNDKNFQRVKNSELYKYLEQLKYSLIGWSGVSLLLASSEFVTKLDA